MYATLCASLGFQPFPCDARKFAIFSLSYTSSHVGDAIRRIEDPRIKDAKIHRSKRLSLEELRRALDALEVVQGILVPNWNEWDQVYALDAGEWKLWRSEIET